MNHPNKYRHKKIIHIACTLFCVLFCKLNVKADNITDYCFAIGEFTNIKSLNRSLHSLLEVQNPGLSLSLKNDTDNKTINVVFKDSSQVPFSVVLNKIGDYLKQKNMIFPLFIHYNGSEENFVSALNKQNLLNQIFVLPKNKTWPDISNLLLNNKKLVIFNTSDKSVASKYWVNFDDHVYEYPVHTSVIWEGASVLSKNSKTQQFMSLKSFASPFFKEKDLPDNIYNLSTNAYFLEHFLECWKKAGKVPNFIFYSNNKPGNVIHKLTPLLNDQPRVYGTVSSNGVTLSQITWKHNDQCLTDGVFSFPIDEKEDINLTPIKTGYRFSPQPLPLHIDLDKQHIKFVGEQLGVNQGISAYYKFDSSLENSVSPFQKHEGGVFVNDLERGSVLKFENKTFLELSHVEKYNIVNNSFTISIYAKLSNKGNYQDYCILGSTSNSYRKGLHINIRNGKPYFGFFTTDISSSDTLLPSKWYHIVARYNIDNGEQSIFIDGKKVGVSWNHPSFNGKGPLLLGHSIKQNNFFDGLLDDLYIWDRALSDEEIKILSIRNVENINEGTLLDIVIGVFIVILLLILVFLVFKKNVFSIKRKHGSVNPSNASPQGSINLFGGFKVLNAVGENITSSFTPKPRELFLLLLFNTIKNPKGIAKDELTQIIWGNLTSSKISNNRSVTLNRLKKALKHLDGIDVAFENNFWKLSDISTIPCDYKEVVSLIQNNTTTLNNLVPYIKKGRFLPVVKKEWLLDFRTAFNFELIDKLIFLIKNNKSENQPELVYFACNYILELDDQNETALFYLIHNMVDSGSSNKARFIFDKFCKTYKSVNNSKFPYDFNSFLQVSINEF
ncbi:LamG-like jellyroll fold domain-containing protein [Flavivirga eckloniae]|uniref:LamG-like jellyroll fold domain-containing protein n=1 Tax=Flavivirga eckloniae TaxID=1803846 RepID=A0A2K9PUE3_9FLAO|nr:LamG-like jellyroll fold domain-containing protein [Flavivirga eckloniae]AUP80695.1 hypothetical protein C1H87_19040 [Flavivirga eckloniae]